MSEDVLTVDEVAEFLRTDPANVRQLLEDGELAGFKVAGEWRILTLAVVEYLKRETAATQDEALWRRLGDPREWVKVMSREDRAFYRGRECEPGTWGAWIKDALLAEEREAAADNVVRLDSGSH